MRTAYPILFSLALCGTMVAAASSPSTAQSGWVALARMNADTAKADFSATTSTRESRLGHALALLSGAEKTATNLQNCRRELIDLRDEDSSDDYGIAATYYLARIAQHYEKEPDIAAIISTYRDLLSRHPGHPVAELAAPKFAILLLYADVASDEQDARFNEIEALLPSLKHPHNQRDTRLVLADAFLRLRRNQERAYPLINYCLDRGLILRSTRLNQYLLQAAEAARMLGLRSEALRHYERYIETFPHDDKTDEVRRLVQRLNGEPEHA